MDVTCYRREASALAASLLVRAEHIDNAVAARAPAGAPVHTGVASAGGLAIEVLVPTANVLITPPGSALARLVCTRAATATDSQAILAVSARMPARAVRRTPVVDAPAALRGIVTPGDLRKMSWSDVRASLAVMMRTALVITALAGASGAVHAVSTAQDELAAVQRSTPDLDRGAQLFETCAACHGPDGGGTSDGQVPRIGGQHLSVLRKQLVDYRHDKRWDVRMEHFADRHHLENAQSIADVTAYIHQLAPRAPPGEGSGKLLEKGAALYSRQCRSCHASAGEGNGTQAIPRIGGQHYEYLQRQFYDAVDGRRPNFSPAHIHLLAGLDHEDIEAVADYLSRLPGTTKPAPAGPGAGIR